jgi:hypothetical protein
MIGPEDLASDMECVLDRFAIRSPEVTEGSPPKVAPSRAEICEWIKALAASKPQLFSRFDYGWALDPRSYRDSAEAVLQMETLFVLSEIDPKHPALATHRPTVVRVVATVDFASTFVRGELCDYILISRPHYVLLRELAVLLRTLHAGAPPEIRNARPMLPDSWIGDAVDELLTHDRERLRELVEPIQKHAVALYQEELPPDPVLLNDWLDARGVKGDPFAWELVVMYTGADHFVLFHELSHALDLDPHDGPRDLATELSTDRGALSLMLIGVGSSKARVSLGLPELPPEDLLIGPTAYLHLLRMLALFHGAWRSAAALADQTFAPEDRAVAETRRA